MRFSILSRYLFREFLLFFSISLGAFTGILFTVRMLKFASLVINKGVDSAQIGMVFLSIIPTFLEFAIPLATLLGVMLAFARLSGDSEVVVIRASGVSFPQLLKPVIAFGLIITLFSAGISNILKPWGYRTLADTLLDIARSKSTAALEQGIFNKLGGLTIYCDAIDNITGEISRVLIDDKRDPMERKLVVAQHGQILSNALDRTISLELREGYIHEVLSPRYIITRFRSNSFMLDSDELYDPDGQQKGRSAREFTGSEISTSLKGLITLKQDVRNGQKIDFKQLSPLLQSQLQEQDLTEKSIQRRMVRNRIEQGIRISMPSASFILALLGMALGIQPSRTQRAWGAGVSALAGMLAFVIYYALLSLGITMAEADALAPWVALWIPNVVVFALAAGALYQLSTERWSSVVQIFEEGLQSFHQRIQRLLSRSISTADS